MKKKILMKKKKEKKVSIIVNVIKTFLRNKKGTFLSREKINL